MQDERAAIGRRREDTDGRFEFFQAVTGELHVLHDGGEWRAAGMSDGGTFETGMNFFGDSGAADDGAAFKNQGLVAFFREVEGGDERVVAATEDDDVALSGHAQFLPVSLRISRAASRPGAPMMPPPGCVAEPHMYNFLIGVRYLAQPAAGRRKKSCSSESSPWKMFPSVRPVWRSMSSGVMNCFPMMMFFMFGAYSAIVSITVLPKASRCSSQFPLLNL